MQITILTVGSRGDVQPLVALGRGLRQAGHMVRVATHRPYESLVREQGLEFALVPAQPRGVDASTDRKNDRRSESKVIQESLRQWVRAGLEASQDADALIFAQLFIVGPSLAEKLGVPYAFANHTPLTPTRAFPTVFGRATGSFGGAGNLLTHHIDRQLFWQSYRPALNRLRREELGLAALPLLGPYGRMARERRPILYGYSPQVMPPPPDWANWIHVTGYWRLPRAADWQPPDALVRFLDQGPPPVFFGLGSITESMPASLLTAALDGLARAGQRAIMLTGSHDLGAAAQSETTFCLTSAAYDWLFPRVAAVISHGGPGTVAYALAAGVPQMALPVMNDDRFWGRRLHALGVGPAPVPCDRLTPELIAGAAQQLANDGQMRARAAALGRTIAAEDGVANAVTALEAHLTARMPVAVGV